MYFILNSELTFELMLEYIIKINYKTLYQLTILKINDHY